MLEVRKLYKKFDNNVVLKNISVDIEKGDRIAIIGPSGSGKSTFLRCLNLLEKPTSGKIYFEGKNICENDFELSLLRRKIGMVFQQFNLFPHLTVLENIILGPVKLGFLTENIAKKEAFDLLESINLRDKANCYPDELSGGQKQRVAIARTLIMKPEVILFDEPTSALDPEMVSEVLDLIMNLSNEQITMIMVSHEMSFVKNFATKILLLEDGKVSYFGKKSDAYKNSDNARLMEFLHKNK